MSGIIAFSAVVALLDPSLALAQLATAHAVAERMGLSAAAIERIENGEVVAEALEASSDKDLALVVIARLDASLDAVFDFVDADRMAEFQSVTISSGPIDPSDPSLAKMQLPIELIEKLARDPGGTFFMSEAESDHVAEASKQGTTQALVAYRRMLAERARSYWENGIDGIAPYAAKGRSPAIDLAHANTAAKSIVKNAAFLTELDAVPARSSGTATHKLSWAVEKGRDQAAPVLIHHILYREKDGEILLRRRFYSGYDYDALQIVVGVLPISTEATVVVYTNHTYTDQVAGFGGSAKRSIGRKLLEKELVSEMKRAQKVIREPR